MSDISRRAFTSLCFAAEGSVGAGAQSSADDRLQSELLMDLILDTQPANNIGSIGVNRVIVPVSGGTFDGPKLKGTVLPGGDWIVRRPDGSSVLDVRIILQTDDAQKIYMQYRGIKYTYWRIVPVFETGAEKYTWLNNIIAVGVHRTLAGKIAYRIFQIL